MAWSAIRTALLAASLSVLLAGGAQADDNLKIAIGQRGGWEQSVCELGQDKGFFKKHGLTLDVLYTQGSAETLQSVTKLKGAVQLTAPGSLPNDGKVIADERPVS